MDRVEPTPPRGRSRTVASDLDLVKITFKAKRNIKFNLKAADAMLVDKALNTIQ